MEPLLDFSSLVRFDGGWKQRWIQRIYSRLAKEAGADSISAQRLASGALPMVEDAAQADAVQAALTELELEGYVIP